MANNIKTSEIKSFRTCMMFKDLQRTEKPYPLKQKKYSLSL
jgi:hypothetical protein